MHTTNKQNVVILFMIIIALTVEHSTGSGLFYVTHIVTQQGEIGPALHSCAVQCCHLTPAPAH